MGTSGGALLPPIQAVVHEKVNINVSFVVPLIAFCFVMFYSVIGHRWIRYVDEPIINDAAPVEIKTDEKTEAF